MTCKDCAERAKMARDAFLRAAIGESVTHIVKGAAEMAGLKKKTAKAEADAKRDSGAAGKPAKKATKTAQE